MKAHAEDIQRWTDHCTGEVRHHSQCRVVGQNYIPVTVDHDAGVGIVASQDPLDGLAHTGHLDRIEGGLAIARRKTPGEKKAVALAESDVQIFGQSQRQLWSRLGAPGLAKAQMPLLYADL